jgi:hypothetical protein
MSNMSGENIMDRVRNEEVRKLLIIELNIVERLDIVCSPCENTT